MAGRLDEAALGTQSLELRPCARSAGTRPCSPSARRGRRPRDPRRATAEANYRAALELADELGMRPLVAHCHLGLGTLYRRTGKREQAQEHLTTATTMYREMDMRFWLEKAEAEMTESA